MSAVAQDNRLLYRLTKIRRILLVLSGKGGVGKSSVSVQLALSFLYSTPSARIGLLDIDLTGPSLPRMLGLEGQSVFQSTDGWVPVRLDLKGKGKEGGGAAGGVLQCMSIGFLLKNPGDSVVWRGPKKNAMIKQFLADVRWGELDWLIVDTPPGTSDEHISLLEHLGPIFTTSSTPELPIPSLSSVLVTTPQAVSLSDVSKELSFARKTSLPVVGLIENMSGYVCPHCGEVQNVFGKGGGEEFCRQDQEKHSKSGKEGEAVEFLGRVPIDVAFMKLMDQAARQEVEPASSASAATPGAVEVANGRPTGSPGVTPAGHPSGSSSALPPLIPESAALVASNAPTATSRNLLERYQLTPTFAAFGEIAERVGSRIREREESGRAAS